MECKPARDMTLNKKLQQDASCASSSGKTVKPGENRVWILNKSKYPYARLGLTALNYAYKCVDLIVLHKLTKIQSVSIEENAVFFLIYRNFKVARFD